MKLLALIFVSYVVLLAVVTVFQRRLQYFPDRNVARSAAAAIHGVEELRLATEDGENLVAWYIPARAGVRHLSSTAMAGLWSIAPFGSDCSPRAVTACSRFPIAAMAVQRIAERSRAHARWGGSLSCGPCARIRRRADRFDGLIVGREPRDIPLPARTSPSPSYSTWPIFRPSTSPPRIIGCFRRAGSKGSLSHGSGHRRSACPVLSSTAKRISSSQSDWRGDCSNSPTNRRSSSQFLAPDTSSSINRRFFPAFGNGSTRRYRLVRRHDDLVGTRLAMSH